MDQQVKEFVDALRKLADHIELTAELREAAEAYLVTVSPGPKRGLAASRLREVLHRFNELENEAE